MFWDRVAWIYDVFTNIINRKTHKALINSIERMISDNDDVLECACGTGLLSGTIAKHCKQLIATDLSLKMLKKAKKKYKNIANIKGCSAVNYNWDTIEVSAEYLAEFYCQLLIWETINSFGGDFVGASSVSIQSSVGGMANIASQSTYNAFKKAVLAKVDEFYTTPSIAGQTVTLKLGETKTLTDTTGALAAYKDTPAANTSGVTVIKSGSTVTLKATGTPNESGVIRFGYNVDLNYYRDEPGYYYEHAVSQDVTTCGFASRDPAYITINVKVELDGSMKIVKTSEDGKVSGVRFRVTGNGVDTTVQTGTDGTIIVPNLKAGSYTVTELDVPDQYVQPKSQTVTVKANETATVSFTNVLKKWKATITKVDAETGAAQGDASLAGAVYGVYHGSDLIDQYTTNASGQFTTKEYVCGDNWYIQEISPSSGYLLDTTKYPVGAEPDKYTLEHNQIPIGVKEQAIKGKIQIHKQYETLEGTAKDEAAAEFQVYLKSAGSYDKAKASERDTIITSASGYAVTKNMPYGTYIVHQTKGGAGREFVDDFEVMISANNQTYSYELLNELKNGQLKIIKTSDDGKVEGIQFRVTRLADNYSKVYTTDASGLILTETLPIFEDNEGKTKYQYRVEELDTKETFGYALPDPQIVTLEEGDIAEVNFHNVPLEIGTMAKFEDGTKDTQSAQDIVLVDTVRYTGLQVGKEYKLSGVLMNKATAKPFLDFDGNEVTAEATFTPTDADGTVDVTFMFSSLHLKQDTEVVVFETLYREDIELATHAQIDDEGQTVKIRVPEIGTTATSEDGHRVDPLGEVTIFDEVSYTNLKPEKEYTVSGVLMDKATGKAFLDADGKEIKAETTFTPTQPTGTVTVEFVFNATGLHGKEVVAFETLYYEGIELATHAEINDEGQTVTVNPLHGSIMTTKVNADDPTDKISGATFGVYSDADGDGIFNAKTDKLVGTLQEGDTGVYTLDSLPYGKFFLHEDKAPEGFVQDNIYYPFEIKEDGQIVNFETVPGKDFPNKPIKGTVTTTKVDATNPQHKLSGAVFEIYRDADGDGRYTEGVDTLIGRMDEIETGFYSLSDLVYGKYLIYEAQAPANFVRDTIYYPFSITEDGQTVTFETIPGKDFPNSPVPNRPKTGSSRSVLPYIAFAGSALGLTTVLLVRRKKSK